MSKFFINRPVFAWVVAIFIVIAGLLALQRLPVEQYPNVSAPKITVRVSYPGASAAEIEESVLSIMEREMNGIDGLDYMQATADASGSGELALTFVSGTDEDIAQVNVQNAVSQVTSRLPGTVTQNGITVGKQSANFLMVVSLQRSENSSLTVREMSDYAQRNIVPELQRIDGVGGVRLFGAETSMRIWLNPEKLRGYNLSAADVSAAVAAQNRSIPTGSLGSLPALPGQSFSAVINVPGQLRNVAEFENIVLKSTEGGATVRLKDVARVELGQESYMMSSRLNGESTTGMAVQLSNSGNAVAVAKAVKARMAELAQYFPEGMSWSAPYDTSLFVSLSIEQVLHTLLEAMVLVFIVMFLFLQNLRYTLIPAIVVPISLMGAVALMAPLGLSINVLTMFAMVLVIGIVVDDAIVVVENVERLMAEEKLTPYQATRKSMGQISSAIVGITLVNIVVFLPMAFMSGSTGAIYRQFSLVMAGSIGFSGFLALTLTPALCATMLKPVRDNHHEKRGFFGWFNRAVKAATHAYEATVAKCIRISYLMFAVYLGVGAGAAFLFLRLPTSFLPNEDQGFVIASLQLPTGATAERTIEKLKEMEAVAKGIPEIENMFAVQGFSFSGSGQNMGISFIILKDWKERTRPDQSASAISGKLIGGFMGIRDATIFALSPPAIPSLGTSGGFDLMLEDRGGAGHAALLAARNQLMGMAMQKKDMIGQIRPQGLEDAPQLRIDINRDAAYAQNVTISTIASILGTNFGSAYVNDFPNNGRLQRVTVQADAGARMQESDLKALDIPNTTGGQVPLGSIANFTWELGQMQATRYNGYPAMQLSGEAATGQSSGDAMNTMVELTKALPPGFALEWTGLALEEQRAGDQQMYVLGFSLLAVFLCLAALYESWSIPFAVILVVPLGILGATGGIFSRNWFNTQMAGQNAELFANDVYLKVGLITIIGLTVKNAILIIEFAKDLQEGGKTRIQAALQAAHLRFRPIVMTSLAFILGVVPLYFASGASSASQRAIGTSVFWGMSIGTFLGLVMIPIFFVLVRKLFPGKLGVHDKYATREDQPY
ncbi:efflux RND transporter permease subunit [Cardiobacterium valvarum]|uniref:Efflux pump membrane transporter n=1 Tax=Cardiobacterium valvarum F0432 TaxID=797473 RepID=G9ZHS6_9GAMM|nr:efflux RND transporter permease subunit [Cardiobacterium valvarum]EHM52406.1 putative inner membrane multidrug efflux protein BpeB [Cardiobacterium valvarum F0432]